MRMILQRVSSARVRVGDEVVGEIGSGALILAALQKGDTPEVVDRAVEKVATLRFFADDAGRMNLDATAAGADFLIVSQFTLAASLDRGRRPSFEKAAPPNEAEPLIRRLAEGLAARGFRVAQGRFGATMSVELVNEGPVTFVVDI